MSPQENPATKIEAQTGLVVAAFHRESIEIRVGGAVAAGTNSGSGSRLAEADFFYQEGVVLVRDQDVDRVSALLEGTETRDSLINGVTLLGLGDGVAALEAVERVEAAFGIGVATPNHVLSVTPIMLCPAEEPHEVGGRVRLDPEPRPGNGGLGVSVHVVDTGLLDDAETHPWLAGVTGEVDPHVPGQAIGEYTGHGTFVAGVLRCVAPGADVYVASHLDRAGAILESEIIRELDQALDSFPDVISISAGGTTRNNLPPLGFEAFWERLKHYKGTVVVAAAGNNGERRAFWPAAFPGVISVGALSANWRHRADFSNFGAWVDVYAPGEDLVNAYATGVYTCTEPPHTGERRTFTGLARWSGTSFATPLVAGLIATRMSLTGENGRQAAEALLVKARAQAVPGVGAILLPDTEVL
ncbi:S8 family peptidase [Rhizohabitans arisaemae]|uniref:S8 family peptidase n=1 Tax=Rhizohabitans arisaemae TaxID=2720610 RepID=UPI0024B269A4|nr:S8/S53 family peptidase [Rhizohabitans arisaemae]